MDFIIHSGAARLNNTNATAKALGSSGKDCSNAVAEVLDSKTFVRVAVGVYATCLLLSGAMLVT